MVREVHAAESVRAEVLVTVGVFVPLLVPGRVRAGVMWLLWLLAVEHLVEELELRRDRKNEDQQSADQGL